MSEHATAGHPDVRLEAPWTQERLPGTGSEWDDWGEPVRSGVQLAGRLWIIADGEPVGDLTWHEEWYGPTAGSMAYNIGISLAVGARGRGIGWRAQRMLAEHLFATTEVFRVEAGTDVDNVAEQRSLERAGFTREGVARGAQVRADGRHDLVLYAVVRTDITGHPEG